MDADIADQLAAIRSSLVDHIKSNNAKFAEYDSMVKQLTGMLGMSPIASAPALVLAR